MIITRPVVDAAPVVAAAPIQSPEAKISDTLIVRMRDRADLKDEALLPRGPERRTAVFADLMETAKRTQAPVVAKLEELKAAGAISSFESMYLPNALIVNAASGKQSAVAEALKGFAEIQGTSQNKTFALPMTTPAPVSDAMAGAANIEWGVSKIGAPNAWAKGYTGAGVTVGVVDTGLDATHEALKAQYRGTNADGSQTHDYNWFDPFTLAAMPYDDGDHGTHVAGSVAGGTNARTTGVAPGAKIIAAKAINGAGSNTTEATLKALQFMLAPTTTQGLNPDPTKGADVVNNSWGNADMNDATFRETWDGLLAAGIAVVTAAGNDGPFGKISPPGSYPGAISVAATTSQDKVAGFSSRGPSKFAPEDLLPNLAAPGQGVTSTLPGGRYGAFSGTSMASPHVAGAVALMLQAKPTATNDEILKALGSTATDIDRPGPDLNAGYGRINVDKAIDALLAG